jgi:hydrogenase expression/formation protein HypC
VTSAAVGHRSSVGSCACTGDHCITCSDEAVPMTVVRVDAAGGLATCRDALGHTRRVETALLNGVEVGSRVLVHADVAIAAAGSMR